MDHKLAKQIVELAGAADPDATAELELWAAKARLQRGELEQAAVMLVAAAGDATDAALRAEIASQLLLLARAWSQQTNSEKAEEALQAAAELSPAMGLPALAQFLQRQKREQEAISKWREAVRLNPQDANAYLSLGRLLEQSGRPEQALAAYMSLMDAAPTGNNYLSVARRLDELAQSLPEAAPNQAVKIALLGNATLDHLQSYIKVECYRAGLRSAFYQGGFDQYAQDILDPQSGLYAFAPDVLILAVHASRLFPQLHSYPFDMSVEQRRAEMEAGLDAMQNLLDTFAQRSPALVLLHSMILPQYPALGILDQSDELGQAAMFTEINTHLAQIARSRYKNVYILDEEKVQARYGKSRATDPRLWLTARMGWSEAVLPGLAREYLRFIRPLKGLSRKCIVLDLDDTLWGGVIGEDGLEGIQVGSDAPGNAYVAFQRELEKLWRRGILLAIASKNNPEDALQVFEKHPGMVLKLSHFAAQRINWQEKAANIQEIAKELNIGLDSMVFLDDNPVERAKMRAELPQVLTLEMPTDPALFRTALLDLDVFDTLALTGEDRNRNKLYAEQKARQEFEAKLQENGSGGSLDDYLAALNITVEIAHASSMSLPRIAQLTNKTNQFNLTTRRYSEAQISEMTAKGWQVYSMRVTDRFGDNGLVGVAIVEPKNTDIWELDTLLLSCRVLGRGVETALLALVAEQAREQGIKRLQGRFLPTPKNDPAKDCYGRHGFTLVERDPDGNELWHMDPAATKIEVPGWLTIYAPGVAGESVVAVGY